MSVVLLEQLVEEVNSLKLIPEIEVYNGITKTGLIEIGLINKETEKSLLLVRAVQSPELSHLECLNQGSAKLIECVFGYGIERIIQANVRDEETKEEINGELEEGSTTLCVNNE